jgi:hypothetical protein
MATALRAADAPPTSVGDSPADVRLLVVEYLDASGLVARLPESGAAPAVPCARGWCGGGWTVAFPADVLVRDLGVSKAALMRNGWFLVRGRQVGGWFVVERVLRRAPITAPDGAVLVSSWPTGASAPTRRWVRDDPDAEAG